MAKKVETTVVEAVEVVENGTEEMVVEEIDAIEAEHGSSSMVAAVRRVLMAGVGVFALTKNEVEDFVSKLVERGEIAEHDGRRLVRDVLNRRRGDAEHAAEKVQDETEKQLTRAESVLDQRIEGILGRLNVPTKSDIDMLSQKISMLAEKVDALKNT